MMIKKLITVIACLAMVSAAIGQEKSNDRKKFSIGAKTGLNVANIVGTNVKDSKLKSIAGFHIGIVSEFKAKNDFAVAPEIMFSTQGTQAHTQLGDTKFEGSINVNYINIPVMARFYVIDCFNVEVGPQLCFATGLKMTLNNESEKLDSKYYNTIDVGMCLGATYNFQQKFFASARYSIGINDIVKEYNNTNSVFQLSVGYNFFSR